MALRVLVLAVGTLLRELILRLRAGVASLWVLAILPRDDVRTEDVGTRGLGAITLAVAAAGCSHRIGLLAAHAGIHPAQEGRIASCSPAGPHNPAGCTAAGAVGIRLAAVAGSRPGRIHPAEGEGCVPADTAAAAAGRNLGCIGRILTL